jgi:hypothetical protein
LHMIDTMETAYDFGIDISASNKAKQLPRIDKKYLVSITAEELIDDWSDFSIALNEMNRSMGLADAYPFFISKVVKEKLVFIQKVITAR